MLSKLKEYDPEFNESWSKLGEMIKQKYQRNQTKMVSLVLFTRFGLYIFVCVFLKVIQKLLDQTIRKMMENCNVSEFAQLGHTWADFMAAENFKCATDPFHIDNKC